MENECPDCGYPRVPNIPSWCSRYHFQYEKPEKDYAINFQEVKDWSFGGSPIDPESKPAHVEHFGFIKALLDILEGMKDGDSIKVSRIGKTFVMYND